MDRKQRIVMQRVLWLEAEAKLKAVSEYFGAEDEGDREKSKAFEVWSAKVAEFRDWVWCESPIA
ncbi:MAG: hypothetical protein V4720_06455 [Pseudomonadota bacterium]